MNISLTTFIFFILKLNFAKYKQCFTQKSKFANHQYLMSI